MSQKYKVQHVEDAKGNLETRVITAGNPDPVLIIPTTNRYPALGVQRRLEKQIPQLLKAQAA